MSSSTEVGGLGTSGSRIFQAGEKLLDDKMAKVVSTQMSGCIEGEIVAPFESRKGRPMSGKTGRRQLTEGAKVSILGVEMTGV
jgi:hypothetical protein